MNDAAIPRLTRTYRSHHLDSTRWEHVRLRPGDIVVSTSIKSGTTWMQRILSLLVFGTKPLPDTLFVVSPWVDSRFHMSLDTLVEVVERQDHQRFLKSHLPLDALPYDPEVRYIWVCRDTRDVFMSLWNHYRGYTDAAYARLAEDDPEGGPLPRCPGDPRVWWREWMTRGWFAWETDGWPFWSHHSHAASFWAFRHLPNLLLVHYNDLLADLPGQMRRVAEYVGIDVPAARWPALVDAARFQTMKREADTLLGADMALRFKDGPARFIHKGTNQRWRAVLSDDDLVLYEHAAAKLDPGLRRWMEHGFLGSKAP